MKGKHLRGLVSLAAASVLAIMPGCGGGGDGGGSSDGDAAETANPIVGTWRQVSTTTHGNTVTVEAEGIVNVVTANADGTWSETWSQGNETIQSHGTLSISGNQMTAVAPDEDFNQTWTFSVNGNTLTLTDADGVVQTYVRTGGETPGGTLSVEEAAGRWTGRNSFGETISATVRADGSFTMTVPAGTVTGTYVLNGSRVTGTYGDGFGTFIGDVSGTTMTGRFTEIDGDVATFTMTKQ